MTSQFFKSFCCMKTSQMSKSNFGLPNIILLINIFFKKFIIRFYVP